MTRQVGDSAKGPSRVPLFDPEGADSPALHADKRRKDSPTRSDTGRVHRTRNSALWAAYGDALGFISELRDEPGLARRTGGRPLDAPMAWRRRIGGRFGVDIELPAGCYSDDTQLRLATGRAICSMGFDVEAFARVELPVWLSYALGGGKATRSAATNLSRRGTSWFANEFKGWTEAGGNGAAMRIQPHVWAAADLGDPNSFVADVLRNAVCTHGHPRALVGAVLHALCLATALRRGETPTPADVPQLVSSSRDALDILIHDAEVGEYWVPRWTAMTRRDMRNAWENTIAEADEKLRVAHAAASMDGSPAERYGQLLDKLDLFAEQGRGSGLLTVVAALALTWIEPSPKEAARIAANAIGSDTDTIATLTGSLLGATSESDTSTIPELLDAHLIAEQAERLAGIATGDVWRPHLYPDLLRWSPPKTQSDALVQSDRGLEVVGLGPVSDVLGDPITNARKDASWQWVRLAFGQTLLIKRRPKLRTIHASEAARRDDVTGAHRVPAQSRMSVLAPHPDAAGEFDDGTVQRPDRRREIELERVYSYLESHKFSDGAIALAVRQVALRGSPEQLITLTAHLRARLR